MRQNFNKTILPALLLGLVARGSAQPASAARARWLMGTALEITAAGSAAGPAVEAAFREVDRLDRVLSLYKEDSEASRLNRAAGKAPFPCSPALWEAISLSRLHHRNTRGAFDPTILPLARSGTAALPRVGFFRVRIDDRKREVFLPAAGMGLDFGGIGKGLALDKAAAALRSRGVASALLNFGGQVQAVGTEPGRKGWRVEVPGGPSLLIKDASVSTSGNSEQGAHIFSPLTGRPVPGRAPVTVVAPTGAEADAWSTALFVNPKLAYDGCVLVDGRPRNEAACEKYYGTKGEVK